MRHLHLVAVLLSGVAAVAAFRLPSSSSFASSASATQSRRTKPQHAFLAPWASSPSTSKNASPAALAQKEQALLTAIQGLARREVQNTEAGTKEKVRALIQELEDAKGLKKGPSPTHPPTHLGMHRSVYSHVHP